MAPLVPSSIIALIISISGYRRNSLSLDGAISGFFVGTLHFFAGNLFGITLFSFFLSSSILTKLWSKKKKQLESDYDQSSQRNTIQVIANSFFANLCLLSLVFSDSTKPPIFPRESLIIGFLAHYSCCNADTWASEIGITSKTHPFHILTFRTVPPGTNGGVTPLGLLSSLAGGSFIGIFAAIFLSIFPLNFDPTFIFNTQYLPKSVILVLFCSIFGLLGSIIDSILGCTIQATYFDKESRKIVSKPSPTTSMIAGYDIVDNHMVNLLASTITGLIAVLTFGG